MAPEKQYPRLVSGLNTQMHTDHTFDSTFTHICAPSHTGTPTHPHFYQYTNLQKRSNRHRWMNLSTHCEGDTPPHPHSAFLYNPFSLTSSAKKNNQDSNIQMFDSIKHYAPVFLFILYMAIHGKIWYQKLLNSKLETPQRSLLDNKLWEPGF